ncbi:hypothetical protein D3C87_1451450 [compost metagenome]
MQFHIYALTVGNFYDLLFALTCIFIGAVPCINKTNGPIGARIALFHGRVYIVPNTVLVLVFNIFDKIKNLLFRFVDGNFPFNGIILFGKQCSYQCQDNNSDQDK